MTIVVFVIKFLRLNIYRAKFFYDNTQPPHEFYIERKIDMIELNKRYSSSQLAGALGISYGSFRNNRKISSKILSNDHRAKRKYYLLYF